MSNYVTLMNSVSKETEEKQLDILLENLFRRNGISIDESISIFSGDTSFSKKDQLYVVTNIQTIGGHTLGYNLDDEALVAVIGRTKPVFFGVGERIVFVGNIRRPLSTQFPLNAGLCWSFKLLGLTEESQGNDWVRYICKKDYLDPTLKNKIEGYFSNYTDVEIDATVFEKYSTLSDKAKEFGIPLGQVKELLTLNPNVIDAEVKKIDALEAKIDSVAPDGIDLTTDKIEALQKRITEIAPEGIEKREQELDCLQKRIDSLSGIAEKVDEAQRKARFFLGIGERSNASNESITILPSVEKDILKEFITRIDYKYDQELVVSFLTALGTTQIITLFGEPGTGKTTFVSKIAKALGAKCSIISVQNNWTDSSDLLGYYSPIDKTYESTPFVEALIDANREWLQKGLNSRLHIICLDEMNLARVEYYFALFLGLLQLDECDRWIRILPKHVQQELEKLVDPQKSIEQKEYLKTLKEYADFRLPPNVRFVGTINSDDTTNFLSPKVVDRSYFIELSRDQHAPEQSVGEIEGYYPISFFDIESAPDSKELNVFKAENNRFKDYAKEMLVMYRDRLKAGKTIKPFCEQLIITKILPALRRTSDYPYDAKEYPNAFSAYEKHKYSNGDAYNYLGGNR